MPVNTETAKAIEAEKGAYTVSYGEELIIGDRNVQNWLKTDKVGRRKIRMLEFNDKFV